MVHTFNWTVRSSYFGIGRNGNRVSINQSLSLQSAPSLSLFVPLSTSISLPLSLSLSLYIYMRKYRIELDICVRDKNVYMLDRILLKHILHVYIYIYIYIWDDAGDVHITVYHVKMQ